MVAILVTYKYESRIYIVPGHHRAPKFISSQKKINRKEKKSKAQVSFQIESLLKWATEQRWILEGFIMSSELPWKSYFRREVRELFKVIHIYSCKCPVYICKIRLIFKPMSNKGRGNRTAQRKQIAPTNADWILIIREVNRCCLVSFQTGFL